jgi:hypothetical protein
MNDMSLSPLFQLIITQSLAREILAPLKHKNRESKLKTLYKSHS